jgi:transposase, IS5 family
MNARATFPMVMSCCPFWRGCWTLENIIPEIEALTGACLHRILADAGYRGHNAPKIHKLRVLTAGQKRRVTPAIKRQMKRRSAVEPVIGHIKAEHRMGRNFLAHDRVTR